MSDAKTITYSENAQGWTSFHSYNPQWMAGMNNDFYTFYGGKIWKHHTNQTRNNYYDTQHDSVMRTVFNAEADRPKMFKTVKLKGKSDSAWSAVAVSDLGSGLIDDSGYEKKEGNWYGYIRRQDGDLDLTYLSTQGLGIVYDASPVGDTVEIVMFGDYTSNVNVKSTGRDNGDLVFEASVDTTDPDNRRILSTSAKIGQVQSISYNSSTNETTLVMVKHPEASGAPDRPQEDNLIIVAKSSSAESYGLRGAYMDVTLTNSDTTEVELLTVASEVFKSYQ